MEMVPQTPQTRIAPGSPRIFYRKSLLEIGLPLLFSDLLEFVRAAWNIGVGMFFGHSGRCFGTDNKLISQKKIEETLQIWGLGGLGTHFYCNFSERLTEKLHIIILLHSGLVTFEIHCPAH